MNSLNKRSTVTPIRSIGINNSSQNCSQCNTPQLIRSPMINQSTSKNLIFMDHTPKCLTQKSISFSQCSPIRYSIPDSFKTPPNSNIFKDPPTCSSILRNKKISQNYEKQVMCTPSSLFKTTFNEKSQGSISPLINRYAYFEKSRNNQHDSHNEKYVASYKPSVLIIIAGCIIVLAFILI